MRKSSIKTFLIAILFLLFSENLANAQTSAFDFLRQPTSAQASALGDNMTSSKGGDLASLFYNPATLADTSLSNKLFLNYQKLILDINSGAAAYAKYFNGIGTFSISTLYINYGSFDKRNTLGQLEGTFSSNDLYFSFSFGRQFINLPHLKLGIGASVKYIFSQIDVYHSSAIAFDAGAIISFPTHGISAGISFLNLGTQLYSYNGTMESIPYDLRLSGSFALLEAPITFTAGWVYLMDSYPTFFERFLNFTAGVEGHIENIVFIRVGYNNRRRLNMIIPNNNTFHLGGFSFGVGGKFLNYRLDYAAYSLGLVGWQHLISFGVGL